MKCCICNKEIEDKWGNNPYPVSKNQKDRCCNKCNETVVIPERIKSYIEKKGKENE